LSWWRSQRGHTWCFVQPSCLTLVAGWRRCQPFGMQQVSDWIRSSDGGALAQPRAAAGPGLHRPAAFVTRAGQTSWANSNAAFLPRPLVKNPRHRDMKECLWPIHGQHVADFFRPTSNHKKRAASNLDTRQRIGLKACQYTIDHVFNVRYHT
jgi:hypothetical protein